MTEYDKEWLISFSFVFVFVFVVGIMFIGAGTLDYQLKTNNYQTALKMITECRVQAKLNPDEICGKIPTWEQYK
jgi:Na+/pantothenate symporter